MKYRVFNPRTKKDICGNWGGTAQWTENPAQAIQFNGEDKIKQSLDDFQKTLETSRRRYTFFRNVIYSIAIEVK